MLFGKMDIWLLLRSILVTSFSMFISIGIAAMSFTSRYSSVVVAWMFVGSCCRRWREQCTACPRQLQPRGQCSSNPQPSSASEQCSSWLEGTSSSATSCRAVGDWQRGLPVTLSPPRSQSASQRRWQPQCSGFPSRFRVLREVSRSKAL
uniref:Putative secreted protein n=1 Tax=Ixodes ricinus TaxID=34613 RepID=A0A147BC48_IXORI